ncbi:hypothetical protein SUGI_1054720 [Cryptomeria japonica]|uniref:protein PLANT CADMIUM RESISTANCE 2 isoform X2 n=1 Tax=Cryptomeria japonica TaxID=3369 RepID=UPI00241472F2|nr:protein PLANT CADMIUM RESISTANCE 2 isoform X2 [Cryptomeria japonica]GLJ49697.1 hypothetical protein SUGI_1054720 [Cryptomeria japonica]
MYAPKAEQELEASTTLYPQHIATGYPPPFQNPSQYVHPPPPPPPPHPYPLRPTEWSSGLCACCHDPSNCFLTCWCPCITFGQIAEIVDEGSPTCALSGGIYSCLYRNKMRAKYNLSGSPCTDCLVHFICDECALCQEYRELKHRGYHPALGWRGQQQEMGIAMAAPGHPTMAR